MLGEPPPPPPRAFFGREELVERVVSLAESLNPIALIGVGGVGKTTIALTVLDHGRIKQRFGENRRFIHCDRFPASRANLLRRLAKVIGSSVENPEDLAPLRRSLSSEEMIIVLDNAESILDPQGDDAQEVYRLVDELSQFTNICLVITSRITTIPSNCKTLDIPTLSMEAARETFYRIYEYGVRTGSVDNLLKQLDFHPLSITLLATVAHQNKWNNNRMAREWEKHHTSVLRTGHNSLWAAIELSLSSPMFKKLGPDARDLLGVVAFFPQGINEENVDWLFPTIPDVAATLDAFCVLSLTYRSDGFVTMLVPLRDSLCPKDPLLSPLLSAAKESYFTRLSAALERSLVASKETQWITRLSAALETSLVAPKETRWIASEDVNVEHLLSVFTSIDANSDDVWRACANFMNLLYWHKPRLTVLGAKFEQLPDDCGPKSDCLAWLARLFRPVGNHEEDKRLLNCSLKLERERRNDDRVAFILIELAVTNRTLGFTEEGTHQAEEALEIYERNGYPWNLVCFLIRFTVLLCSSERLDAAEAVTSQVMQPLKTTEQDRRPLPFGCRRFLGNIYGLKRERGRIIHDLTTVLGIASRSGDDYTLYWIHYFLALLFHHEDKPDDARPHIEQAKSLSGSNTYDLGRVVGLQGRVYYQQGKLEDARTSALHALEIFEKLGAAGGVDECRDLLQSIEGATHSRDTLVVPVSSQQ